MTSPRTLCPTAKHSCGIDACDRRPAKEGQDSFPEMGEAMDIARAEQGPFYSCSCGDLDCYILILTTRRVLPFLVLLVKWLGKQGPHSGTPNHRLQH